MDHRGRSFDEVLRLSAPAMEATHDYIQWLFPLDVPSSVTRHAPIVDEHVVLAFAAEPALKTNLLRATDKMLGFYGLKLAMAADGAHVVRTAFFARRVAVWLTPDNHNYMRLTRILKSLSLLGQAPLARQLLVCLEGIYAERAADIGPETLEFWRRAVQ